MTALFRCPCGQSLRVDGERASLHVRCPTCDRTLVLPPESAESDATPASGKRVLLFVAAGVLALAIVAGIGLALGLVLSGPDSPTPQSDVQAAAQPKAPAQAARSEPPPAKAMLETTKTEVSHKPPTVAILRTTPDTPRPGEAFVLHLGGGSEARAPIRFQYRLAPSENWRPAPDGRVRLESLSPGPLTIEVCALDRDQQPSEIFRKTWTVPPRQVPEKPAVISMNQKPFYQTVAIRRASGYRVLETDFHQGAQYSVISRFEMEKVTADGGLVVRQKVEAVQLSEADPALQADLNALLKKIKGATFRLTFNDRREVTQFDGEAAALKVLNGQNLLGGQGYILWSFLDKDGWKELAQLAFFKPDKPLQRGKRWSRPMTHQWGPLGAWSGRVGYVCAGQRYGLERIDYALDLAYKPPLAGMAGGLPFEIGKCEFRLGQSGGHILFDPVKDRVTDAEERFQVRGRVPVNALGVAVIVDMEEVQVFQVRISEDNPLEKNSRIVPGRVQ